MTAERQKGASGRSRSDAPHPTQHWGFTTLMIAAAFLQLLGDAWAWLEDLPPPVATVGPLLCVGLFALLWWLRTSKRNDAATSAETAAFAVLGGVAGLPAASALPAIVGAGWWVLWMGAVCVLASLMRLAQPGARADLLYWASVQAWSWLRRVAKGATLVGAVVVLIALFIVVPLLMHDEKPIGVTAGAGSTSTTVAHQSTTTSIPQDSTESSVDRSTSSSTMVPTHDGGGTEVAGKRIEPCGWEIGDFGDDDSASPVATEAFKSAIARRDEWRYCADAAAEEVAPGKFRQLLRSQLAGPGAWLYGYYDADGVFVTGVIPPQVGLPLIDQFEDGDWLSVGFPHEDVLCGTGRLQIFWNEDGVISGYVFWSDSPEPPDVGSVAAWFVPRGIAFSQHVLWMKEGVSMASPLGSATGFEPDRAQGFPNPIGILHEAEGQVVPSDLFEMCAAG